MRFSPATRKHIALYQRKSSLMALLRRRKFQLQVFALLVTPAMLGEKSLTAQTHTSQAAKLPQRLQVATKATQETRALPPVASPAALWPINQPANHARVTWDGRGLEIEASDSSLDQILEQVAADTGAKLEGLTQDERVFGSYGPGPGCEVLSKLLAGSGYNVLMIGSRKTDAPLEIVLSVRVPASVRTAAVIQDRRQPEPQPPPDYPPESPRPQPPSNPFDIGGPPREPLQLMQEILGRQNQIDQQQQPKNL